MLLDLTNCFVNYSAPEFSPVQEEIELHVGKHFLFFYYYFVSSMKIPECSDQLTSKMKNLLYTCMLCLILFIRACCITKIRPGWVDSSFSMESCNFKILSSLPIQGVGSEQQCLWCNINSGLFDNFRLFVVLLPLLKMMLKWFWFLNPILEIHFFKGMPKTDILTILNHFSQWPYLANVFWCISIF